MPGYHKKPKGYVSDAQRKAVHASKKDGGKGNPNKPKMVAPVKGKKKVYAKMDKRRHTPPTIGQIRARRDKNMLETIKVDARLRQSEREMAADPVMFRSANVSRANYTGPKVVQPPVEYEKRQAKKDFFRKGRAKLKDFSQVYNMKNKPKAKFPDLSGDGKITKKDILMGRGVIDKPKMLRKKRKNYA